MTRKLKSAAALLGAVGGKAKGKCKVRGTAEYYRALVAKRKDRKASNPGK